MPVKYLKVEICLAAYPLFPLDCFSCAAIPEFGGSANIIFLTHATDFAVKDGQIIFYCFTYGDLKPHDEVNSAILTLRHT